MVDLFSGKILIRNNRDRDEIDTDKELYLRLENKVVLLYFGSGECPCCEEFVPVLKDFFVKLTDEFYVNRCSQIVLVYISQDETEEKQDKFLKKMPKRWLFLPFEDELKRDLEYMFNVNDIPTVVVLKPNGDVITMNAVDEIKRLGPDCFKNWQEVADIIDRSFLLPDDFDDLPLKSATDPFQRLKYKVDKKKKDNTKKEAEEKEEIWS
ncbi:nucleoredoxin-like protein 1 [Protopterus annectens]|uniref:nucleoredoxin-like protein 1 n=1 Tax=Protopterus annectens TaxID=7888 RepID=UPI001CFA95AA|nr:nucleoredoxin-like protein 1 [Protopterus annectens]